MKAKNLAGYVSIKEQYEYEGTGFIHVDCQDFDEFEALAKAIEFKGQIYGLSAWNSDKNEAYYRTDKVMARAK